MRETRHIPIRRLASTHMADEGGQKEHAALFGAKRRAPLGDGWSAGAERPPNQLRGSPETTPALLSDACALEPALSGGLMAARTTSRRHSALWLAACRVAR